MKILGYANNTSGPSFHRVFNPLIMMPVADTYITNIIDEATIAERKPDIFYYNRFLFSDEVFTLRKQYGFKIVVDVDDYWILGASHPLYWDYIDNNIEALQLHHLRQADLVTVTHERLADAVYPYNPNILIAPNAIPKNKHFAFEPIFSPVARLFYQGSITHENDLKLLRNPLKRVNNPKVIAGYNKCEELDRMAAGFDVKLPAATVFEYYKHYAHADICLVPLLANRFNSYKSNLKVLEAAAAGCPAIVSAVDPYLDMPVNYVHTQTDWVKHIRTLSDKGAWYEAGKQLQKWCENNYNFDKINFLRHEAFKKLIPQKAEVHF